MKTSANPGQKTTGIKTLLLAIAVFCTGILNSATLFAQDAPEKVTVDVNTSNDAVWYGQPWVWVVGLAVFIIIIIAITRNNSNRNA